MRAHTAPGTARTLALAPKPTAVGFLGKRVGGSAPARGTGASLKIPAGVACGGDAVLARDGAVVVVRGLGTGVLLVFGVVSGVMDVRPADDVPGPLVVAVVDAAALRVADVAVSTAAGGPTPQPARTRQVRALVVLLRGMVRSVRLRAAPSGASFGLGLRMTSLSTHGNR